MTGSTLTGAIVAVLIYILTVAVFLARLASRPALEYWLGLALILLIFPLIYSLFTWKAAGRSWVYAFQVALMIAYLLAELLLDYVFKLDFRSVRWMTIAYVTLFFGGTGGMIGVASHAGKGWTYGAIVLFLGMTVLAFVQRRVTGM
jgi:hypothetical protein